MKPFGSIRRRASRPLDAPSRAPVLAVDIDGVVLLHGFADSPRCAATELTLLDDLQLYLSTAAAGRLLRLARDFECVWASGWEEESERIAALMGLPDWPHLTFEGVARFGSAHWKLVPLGHYASGRPLAWIDDSLDVSCYAWARARKEPTLLVETEPDLGIEEVHVEALTAWARSLSADARDARREGSLGRDQGVPGR